MIDSYHCHYLYLDDSGPVVTIPSFPCPVCKPERPDIEELRVIGSGNYSIKMDSHGKIILQACDYIEYLENVIAEMQEAGV